MATLATIFSRIFSPAAAGEVPAAHSLEAPEDLFLVRAFPNEDVYFLVKEIDNSRVVREADPVAPKRCWKMIAAGGAAVALLVLLLVPSAYSRLTGYQIQALMAQRQQLLNERAALDLEEARLLSPERLEELAKMQEFIDPAPGSVIYLPPALGSLALNLPQK